VIAAFGAGAELFAEGLGDLEAVITDTSTIAQAYLEAVRRRERGESFYGMVLYNEPRAQTTLGNAWNVLAQIGDFDGRRLALDRLGAGTLLLGAQPAAELWSVPAETKQRIDEFLSLANGVLVRSYAEAARLAAFSARPRSIEPVLSEPKIPAAQPGVGGGPGVVIWAPYRAAAFVAWYAFALAEFFGDVTCVTAGGALPPNLPARFVSPLDPSLPRILNVAQCVLCPEPDDPGAAVAFARLGFGVAAPQASGAQEYVRDIVTFGLTQIRDVQIAVKIAIGRPASVRAIPQPLPAPTLPALPVAVDDLPLVSIIVLTYNRPADLTNCLRDLAKQTYPNIDIVVANDAGEDVSHIVAPYPRARIVNMTVNGGVLRLIIEGFKHVNGTYVQLLADDDTLFPDHIERLMAALLNSGAAVVHGNTLIRYQRRGENGELSLSGYNATVFSDSTTPTEALLSTPVAGQSMIIRRDIIDEIGGYRPDTALADQEFQLRAAGRYVFAWVDSLTSEWRVRGAEGYSARTDSETEMRKLYEELHPVPGRPYIEHRRVKALEAFAERPKGFIFAPTILVEGPS
jgi:hypothetical protein